MGTRDPRVDAYIATSADFAKPILEHLRSMIHDACPDVQETMKWSRPHFDYKGMLGGMAAFKNHCVFGFWKGELIIDKKRERSLKLDATGSLGRLTKVSDVPSTKVLTSYIRQAMKLNDDGAKAPHMVNRKPKKPLPVPPYLMAALRTNKKALAAFGDFSPSHKREYVEWITEAKSEATRAKRLTTALEWIADGKPRNWKYIK